MSFLGESQTFIGILASLIVLCVILDKSNFIYSILDEIGRRINEEIEKLDKSVGINVPTQDDVTKESDYKLLSRHIKELREKSDSDDQSKLRLRKALAMDMKLQATFDQLKSSYSAKFLKPAHDLIENIQVSKEQVMAPLYALLFCLAVFICDEIVSGFTWSNDFIVSFLTIFTSVSIVFWIMMWKTFFRDIRIIIRDQSCCSSKIEKSKKSALKWARLKWIRFKRKVWKWIKWKWMYLAFCIFYAICLFASTYFLNIWAKWLISFLIGIILPVWIIASLRVDRHYKLGKYTYEYIFKHFCGLLFISLLIAAETTIGCKLSEEISSACFSYEDFVILKITVISFILVSGLLLPFFMPYCGFRRVLKIVEREVENGKISLEKELRSVKRELKKFCDDHIE